MDTENWIPRIVVEDTMARFERIIKRLITVIILLILIIAIGVYEILQYDITDVTVDSTDGGYANYIGQDGAINNAEGGSAETSQKE